jgi:chromosome partitioning protein
MRILGVANQKGGVGKTTTSINLSAALAEAGKRTLLIDLDPQANASSGLSLPSQPGCSIYPVLGGQKSLKEQIQATSLPDLFVIPGEIDLAGCEVEIARMDEPLVQLRKVFEPLRAEQAFDVVILDCPPSLGILMTNALAACDGLIVPVQCEFFALEGISKILDLTAKMRDQGVNERLEIVGVLMTMFDARTRLSQQVVTEIQKHLPEKVFQTIIPRSIRISEAPSFGQSILAYDKDGVGAQTYRLLARELLGRLGMAG